LVTVGGGKATITVPSEVTCSLGGNSVPMKIELGAVPHTDVTVGLAV
jgi:hypothetical protein